MLPGSKPKTVSHTRQSRTYGNFQGNSCAAGLVNNQSIIEERRKYLGEVSKNLKKNNSLSDGLPV